MILSRKFKYIVLSMLLSLGLAACEKPGPAETAGKNIDQTVEKAGDKVNETADNVSDSMKEAADDVSDSMNDKNK